MTHSGFPSFEFVVDLHRRLPSRLRLQDSFVVAVDSDGDRPTGFWLQVDGCPNGPSWADEIGRASCRERVYVLV